MRNQSTLDTLCQALQSNCGDELLAYKMAGVSPQFVTQWAKDDKLVAEALAEAMRVGTLGLVSAAIRRGVHGVQEDVYYKGMVVGEKTSYSDSLLTTLLKAKVPEFQKEAEGGGTNVTVNVANLMPRAENYEQWLEMKAQTLAPKQKAVAAPTEDAVDVAYSDVTPNPFAGVDL